jgi:hypothetical protein
MSETDQFIGQEQDTLIWEGLQMFPAYNVLKLR